jgi:hypothetical protein
MSGKRNGWQWHPAVPQELAPYVVHHLFVGHRLLPANVRDLRQEPFALARRLYEQVRAEDIRYDREPFNLDRNSQPIRQPHALLLGQRAGNCLDLSLLYAGLCSAAHLRPLIALLRTATDTSHALVLVARFAGPPGSDVWSGLPSENGLSRPMAGELAQALDDGDFVAVELTAATDLLGRLPFDQARAAARATIAGAKKITLVDPIYLQDHGWEPRTDALSLFGPGPGNPGFGPAVADEFRAHLGAEPAVWDLRHISKIPTEPGTREHDTRLALERALLALSAFEAADGRRPGIGRLQGIYYQATGRDSGAEAAEVMLVQAASMKGRKDGLTKLVRFILGVDATRRSDPDETQRQSLDGWLAVQEVQRDDVDRYARDCRTITHWALIHLGEESQDLTLTWPRRLWVGVDPPLAPRDALELECPTEDDLEDALRELMDRLLNLLPEGRELVVDLVAPRRLLSRDIEHWRLIENGPEWQALSPQYKPRLRWSHHLLNRRGRDTQTSRDSQADWALSPQVVPPDKTGDPDTLDAWLSGMRTRPFLIAGENGGSCDPLLRMLVHGHGFILWYSDGSHQKNGRAIHRLWKKIPGDGAYKRENVPDRLLYGLRGRAPAMIWNDLTGRGKSKLVEGRLQSPSQGPSGGNPQ